MGRYTFLRLEVDSDVVSRVLGPLPGVEVADEGRLAGDERREKEERRPTETDDASESPPPAAWAAEESEDGILDRVKPDEECIDEEKTSTVRTYGLLGAGVSFILLGVATIGIWWYKRRQGGETTGSETPPPATGLGATDAVAETEPLGTEPSETASSPGVTERDEPAVERPSESQESPAAHTSEPAGRTEDREDIEWTTRDRGGRHYSNN